MTAQNQILSKAISIACNAHSNQTDKSGAAYILHPLRLMFKFTTINEQIVSVLHDVVEDSSTTLEQLKDAGFGQEIIDALDCLTKRTAENYEGFIKRASLCKIARAVKIEDLKDNLNLLRLSSIDDKDLQRVKKYHQSLYFLLNVEDK